MDRMSTIVVTLEHIERCTPPSWCAECQNVMTLPPTPLLEQPFVVRCLEGLGLSYSQVVRLS
jgi:hypothetical protein